MTRGVRFLLGAVILGLSMAAALPISEENEFPNDFGMFGLIAGQTARLNVVNTIQDPGIMPCRLTVSFFDSDGRMLGGPDTKLLSPGGSSFSDVFISDENDRMRKQIRAVVTAHARSKKELSACSGVIQTLEVFGPETLLTRFMHPLVIRGFNPQPDPPIVVAGGQ